MSLLKVSEITDLTGNGSVYAPGHVVQVQAVTKTDTFSLQSTTFTDVTGLSATITPEFATSKILVTVNLSIGTSIADFRQFRLMRDTTPVGIGDTAGSRTRTTGGQYLGNADAVSQITSESISFLDTPVSTSLLTYKVQVRHSNATGIVYVNRSSADADSASYPRAISSITLMEIAQ